MRVSVTASIPSASAICAAISTTIPRFKRTDEKTLQSNEQPNLGQEVLAM